MASLRRRRVGVMVRNMGDDVLILDRESDQIHQLNQTAGYIWRHIDEAPTPEELAGLLVEAFDVEEQVALADVREALRRFRGLNLVLDGLQNP